VVKRISRQNHHEAQKPDGPFWGGGGARHGATQFPGQIGKLSTQKMQNIPVFCWRPRKTPTLKYRIKGAPFIRGQEFFFCPAPFLFDVRPLYSHFGFLGGFGAPCRHYFGISSVCLSILILRKITQPCLRGPIRAQHTDEVAWFYSNEKRKADPKIVTVASNRATVGAPIIFQIIFLESCILLQIKGATKYFLVTFG